LIFRHPFQSFGYSPKKQAKFRRSHRSGPTQTPSVFLYASFLKTRPRVKTPQALRHSSPPPPYRP
jgi:hypothetical protein